jgi:phenylacetate-CoA ligase
MTTSRGSGHVRSPHADSLIAHLPAHLKRLEWPAERLKEERNRRLRQIVRHAQDYSPWHAERLGGIDADTLTEECMDRLPVMTKDDVMVNWNAIVTDRNLTLETTEEYLADEIHEYQATLDRQPTLAEAERYLGQMVNTSQPLLGEYRVKTTSGSTGRRGVLVFDRYGWITWYLTMSRYSFRRDLRDPGRSPVTVAAIGAGPAGWTVSTPRSVRHRIPVTLRLEEIVERLNALQPDILLGIPSIFYLLTFEAAAGRLRIAPRRITCVGEPLLPVIRSALEDTWPCPIENIWGVSEGGGMGFSCDIGSAMHLTDDLLIIEPVDRDGRPVPVGQRGAKLYLTNLYNRVQPLIRYELSDEVTITDDLCSCGSGHRTVADIQGRMEDTFVYGGSVVHFYTFAVPLDNDRNILEYRVQQTRGGADISVTCLGSVDLDDLRRQIEQRLESQGVGQPDVRISVVASLPRQSSGKLRRFLALPTE